MAEKTGIAWTDSTFNPWIGCTKVGPGCDNCYAEELMDRRWRRVSWGAGKERLRTSASSWQMPMRWEKEHAAFEKALGRRRRVFCASLADVFDNEVPHDWRYDLFALIEATPHLDWLLLTKRIGNMAKMLHGLGPAGERLPLNVWLGATVVNQHEADRDIPKLLQVPASVRFLSIEPMLGPIDFYGVSAAMGSNNHPWRNGPILGGIHWVILGGESGAARRHLEPAWVHQVKDQCFEANVPFFFKQWGGRTSVDGGCLLEDQEQKVWPKVNA